MLKTHKFISLMLLANLVLAGLELQFKTQDIGIDIKRYDYNPTLYYGSSFIDKSEQDLRSELERILNLKHVFNPKGADTLTENCGDNKLCYGHIIYTYKAARRILFGNIHLETNTDQSYQLRELYCGVTYQDNETVGEFYIDLGPELIPYYRIVNTEHVWPQGRFNSYKDRVPTRVYHDEMKLTDLHHLFPTNSQANNDRATYHFSEVDSPSREMVCERVKLGFNSTLTGKYKDFLYFEPPDEIKGDIARALLYFSVKYDIPIHHTEEPYLKKWNLQDPVSELERRRNGLIHYYQGVRNPFIDYPELAQRISDF